MTEIAGRLRGSTLDAYFRFAENGTTLDTMGTLVGVGKRAGYLTKEGELPKIRRPLLVDSVAAMAGGAASASFATTYIESGAGVGVGGRAGWVSVVAGVLFFPFLFFAPLIGMVPQATAPALIIAGWLMITALSEAEERAEPGAERRGERKFAGIDFGFIAYVVVRIAQVEWRRVHPLMCVAAGAFALFFLIPLLHDNLSWI